MKFSDLFKGASKEQTKDFGQVLSLVCLIAALYTDQKRLEQAAVALLLLNLVYPAVYRAFASIWLNFSNLLGRIVSKIILTVVFALLVIPFGLVRKLMGCDSLRLKQWKKDGSSMFKVRDYKYGPEDVSRPY